MVARTPPRYPPRVNRPAPLEDKKNHQSSEPPDAPADEKKMHGGSPAAASQRKTIQASDKEAMDER